MDTKIYATFGPACREEKVIKEMIQAGMTGMRLNLSHTTLPDSEDYILAYQKAAKECGTEPQILIDMQGPELRVGKLEEPLLLKEGQNIILGKSGIPVPEVMIAAFQTGDEILLDDGKIKIEVIGIEGESVKAEVQRGGLLHGRKSIKNTNRNVKMPVLTDHDMENIRLAKAYGVTALMQPFVLSGEELQYVRNTLKKYQADAIQIFAKIENRTGVKNLEGILSEADVLVIARGDLGNDMPLWELPGVQKEMESLCRKYHKPYVVVTQMLASMEENPIPTRAEVSDIFHAVYHGAYGVMITGESAIGKYPVEAVQYLANTAKEAEKFRKSQFGGYTRCE